MFCNATVPHVRPWFLDAEARISRAEAWLSRVNATRFDLAAELGPLQESLGELLLELPELPTPPPQEEEAAGGAGIGTAEGESAGSGASSARSINLSVQG